MQDDFIIHALVRAFLYVRFLISAFRLPLRHLCNSEVPAAEELSFQARSSPFLLKVY